MNLTLLGKKSVQNPFIKNEKAAKYYLVGKFWTYEYRANEKWIEKHGDYSDKEKLKKIKSCKAGKPMRYEYYACEGLNTQNKYSFTISYPCNSKEECVSMTDFMKQNHGYGEGGGYFPVLNHQYSLNDNEEATMMFPALEYDRAVLSSLEFSFEDKDLSIFNEKFDDYISVVFYQPTWNNDKWYESFMSESIRYDKRGFLKAYNGKKERNFGYYKKWNIVQAKDYNSTHDKDMLTILKKLKITQNIKKTEFVINHGSSYSLEQKIKQLVSDVNSYNELTQVLHEQLMLDWNEVKNSQLYKKRLEVARKSLKQIEDLEAEIEKIKREDEAREEAKLEAEKRRKDKLKKYKDLQKQKREEKLGKLREEGI